MNFINEDTKLAVKKGAVWLDDNYPNWAKEINLSQLDMSECCSCIIGQVIGDFNDLVGMEKTMAWAIEHGFDVTNEDLDNYDDLYEGYYSLETIWTDMVRDRLG